MMKNNNRFALIFLSLLVLASLACNVGLDLPFNLGSQEGGISPEDVSIAATRAAEAAAAASTAVSQVDQTQATAVPATEAAPPTTAAPVTGTALEQKLANIQPDANGNFAVTVTDDDLNEFVVEQGGAFQTESFGAQDIQFGITPEHVELTGDVTEPIALPLVVRLRPVVVGNNLQFELISASAGLFPVPDSMLDLIESVANSELSRALVNLPSDVTLQDATLANGEFTIFGQEN